MVRSAQGGYFSVQVQEEDSRISILQSTDYFGTVNLYLVVVDASDRGMPDLNLAYTPITQDEAPVRLVKMCRGC